MSKRAWFVFGSIQVVGCILASYGTVYSESAFVRASWLCGFLLLLPGNLCGMAIAQPLIHVKTAYVFFPVALATNAALWLLCAGLWRAIRGRKATTSGKYCVGLATTSLVFIVINTVHFLRPATCADCFFPYGLPFTFFRDGGFAGGGGLVLSGLFADGIVVLASGLMVGWVWRLLAHRYGSCP